MGAVYVALQRTTGRQRAIKTITGVRLRPDDARALRPRGDGLGAHRQRPRRRGARRGRRRRDRRPLDRDGLLTGDDLAKTVKSGALSREHAALVARQLGHALSAAHRAGVVHRDLKPDNVMLSTPRVDGVPFTVKVLDFGIARFIHQTSVSATTGAIGSPLWMSPEQTDTSLPITPSTDVWAFGLIAFFMLTGQYFWLTPARPNPSVGAMLRELLVDPIPPASARAAELGVSHRLPAGFDAWFARAADREPSRRFPEVAEAAQSLAALLSAAPAASRPSRRPRSTASPTPRRSSPPSRRRSRRARPPPRPRRARPAHDPTVTAHAPLYGAAPRRATSISRP
ncbi:MAG: serine/threonine-protein kinase [Polyangiales bacterium]